MTDKRGGDAKVNIIISNSGETPISDQIARQIKNAIIAGEFRPGEALPSLRFLAKELRVSIISTKRAYEELEREGYITSVPGKGSFVAQINQELLREEQFRKVESYLGRAVETARLAGITCEEIEELVRTLYEE